MIKKEILEIRKQFTPANCAVTRICGCYVDAEKNKKTELKKTFLSLPEEEMFKYFDIFRKTLSGTPGKNLIDMEFPLDQEIPGGTQDFLMKLKASQLNDELLLEEFYDKIIEHYHYGENYYIILIHGAYDIPNRGSDNLDQFDASDDVYDFILCSICPVKLSKAGLCYNTQTNNIEDRLRDWLVEMPDVGFLFPAFNERNTDIHSLLYYSKNADEFQNEFIEQMLGCRIPLPAKGQKNSFNTIIEDTLQEDCSFEAVRNIHDKLTEMMEEKKEEPEPFTLDKAEVKQLLAVNGANPEHLEQFERQYDEYIGEKEEILASNVTNTRKFEVKTPNITIQVNPERTDLLETRMIDGKTYLLIEITDSVEVNGINVRTVERKKDSEN